MSIDVMRFVDRFVGVPLCWLLGISIPRTPQCDHASNARHVRTILVIKFFGMGSILLSTPALSLMKRTFPRARLVFLSFRQNEELLGRIPTIDEVLTIDRSTVYSFVATTLTALKRVVAQKPDICFDFEFFSKFSTLLSGVSGAPIRVGFHLPTRWRSMIVTHQVQLDKRSHVRYAFCNQVESVTSSVDQIPEIDRPRIIEVDHHSLMTKLPIAGKRIVVININAGSTFPERRWPSARFAELTSKLSREDSSLYCFIGSKEESSLVRAVISSTGCPDRCIDASGKLTIPELGALFQRCELLISNDSGPLHLAAALGTRTIALFGPESPDFYGPVHSGSSIIYKRISCSPCMNVYAAKQFHCPYDALCMREISVEEVLECVQSQIYAVA